MRRAIISAVLAVATSAAMTPADGAGYTFMQTGFAQGAKITGSFSGQDKDGDGFLSLQTGFFLNDSFLFEFDPLRAEVTEFEIAWSGNVFVAPFSYNLADLGRQANSAFDIASGFPQFLFEVDGGPIFGDNPRELLQAGDSAIGGPFYELNVVTNDFAVPECFNVLCAVVGNYEGEIDEDFDFGFRFPLEDFSPEPVLVTRVTDHAVIPLPAPALLLLGGLAGLVAVARRVR